MNVFENKNYTVFMYISISMILLLIFFNVVDIAEKGDFEEISLIIFASPPLDLEDSIDSIQIELDSQEELYSEKSYLIYYSILGFLGVCIFLLSFRYLLPYFKKYT